MRRIAIMNQKGGVGKTTTAVNVGAALARLGQRVLLIDLDPQAHLTLHLGLDPQADLPGVYEMLTQSTPLADARHQVGENLWLAPSHIDLAAAEIELLTVVGRELILRDLLDADEAEVDYVLMDCPPSLGVLTLNALAAATEVLVPLQPHVLALQGMGKLLETIAMVSKRVNPQLKVTGVALCMNEHGTRLAAEIVEDLRGFLEEARGTGTPWSDARVFRTVVRRNIKLAESPGYGKPIFDYAPGSNGAWDYGALAAEVVDPEAETEPAPRVEDLAHGVPSDSADTEPCEQTEPETAVPEFGPIPFGASSRAGAGTRLRDATLGQPEAIGVADLHGDLRPWGQWAYGLPAAAHNGDPAENPFQEVLRLAVAPAPEAVTTPDGAPDSDRSPGGDVPIPAVATPRIMPLAV